MHAVTNMKRHGLVHQSETNCRINGKEPNITGKSIQHTPPLGFLSCQTRQLSIRTVIMIRPHQQKVYPKEYVSYQDNKTSHQHLYLK